jgi:hypothetical protein
LVFIRFRYFSRELDEPNISSCAVDVQLKAFEL